MNIGDEDFTRVFTLQFWMKWRVVAVSWWVFVTWSIPEKNKVTLTGRLAGDELDMQLIEVRYSRGSLEISLYLLKKNQPCFRSQYLKEPRNHNLAVIGMYGISQDHWPLEGQKKKLQKPRPDQRRSKSDGTTSNNPNQHCSSTAWSPVVNTQCVCSFVPNPAWARHTKFGFCKEPGRVWIFSPAGPPGLYFAWARRTIRRSKCDVRSSLFSFSGLNYA